MLTPAIDTARRCYGHSHRVEREASVGMPKSLSASHGSEDTCLHFPEASGLPIPFFSFPLARNSYNMLLRGLYEGIFVFYATAALALRNRSSHILVLHESLFSQQAGRLTDSLRAPLHPGCGSYGLTN